MVAVCISRNTALRPIASCLPCPPHGRGTYKVYSSSGCFRPGSFHPGAAFFRPDAPGAPWCSLPSKHTPSAKPLSPAASEAPGRQLPPPEAFCRRILSSHTCPVHSHDTSSLSHLLPNPAVLSPFSLLSSRRFPTPLFVAHYPPHSSRPPDVLSIGRTFSYSSCFRPLPSTTFLSAESFTFRQTSLPSA